MLPKRSQWLIRIKSVEREHAVIRLATDRLLISVGLDPTLLIADLSVKVADVRLASERLDGTYLIRLFAEFETGLRSFWQATRKKVAPSRTRDLVDGVAAVRQVPRNRLETIHEVRALRNALVHERETLVESVSIREARGRLCRFFSYLPPHW